MDEGNNTYRVEIPRQLINRKETELKYADTGAAYAWIDLSGIMKEDGYGLWFPNWLIVDSLEYSTLTIQSAYISSYTGKETKCRFTIEHKEKIQGKRFKRYTYTPEELIELLSAFSDKITAIKEAQEQRALAKITEQPHKGTSEAFYAIGYIKGKMFYSEDIEAYRKAKSGQGGKQVSSKSFKLIADKLTPTEEEQIRELIQAKATAEEELQSLNRAYKAPYPYDLIFKYGVKQRETKHTVEELTEISNPHSDNWNRLPDTHLTISGYPEKLRNIQSAIEEARIFLEKTIQSIEEKIEHFTPSRK